MHSRWLQFWIIFVACVVAGVIASICSTEEDSPPNSAVLTSPASSVQAATTAANFASQDTTNDVDGRPIEKSTRGYISSEKCRSCHAEQYESWHASFHRTMTQVPTKDSVIADFDNKVLHRSGFQFRFFENDGEFFMEMKQQRKPEDSQTQKSRTFRIVLSTGAHHQQAFWCETGRERTLAKIPFIWIIKENRWVPYGSIFMKPSSGLNMHAGGWNSNCIKCHVVGGQPRLREGKGFDTYVAEFGISCEACHGPGETHAVAYRADDKKGGGAVDRTDPEKPTITNPAGLSHIKSSQVCGQCHSVFDFYDVAGQREFMIEDGMAYRPGDNLLDSRHVFRLGHDEDLPIVQAKLKKNPEFWQQQYWSDGMVRVSGREYNGLLESPCYQRGKMSCLSCHDMHSADSDRSGRHWADDQLKTQMRGNAACIECHAEYKSAELLTKHTRHAANSAGSNCYNCHMPHTTLGLMKAMRSHTIDSPNVATTLSTGRPNACNLCHLDKPLAWTGKHLKDWYGIEAPKLGPADREVASSVRWLLTGDAGQRAIVGWHFGWKPAREVSGDRWMAPLLAELLDDSYDVVRFIGFHSLKEVNGFSKFQYDFVGSKKSRENAKSQVLDLWSQSSEKPTPNATLLIGNDRKLISEKFHELRQQRKDPKVILVE